MTEISPKLIATDTVLSSGEAIVPLPINERERVKALQRYNILDTAPEVAFDRITALASRLFNVPVAMISLVDTSRNWFKSSHGFDMPEVPRELSICSFTILSGQVSVILDTKQDQRFDFNRLVHDELGIRFYAGAPLISKDDFKLGALCLVDSKPHDTFTNEQKQTLADLAAMVMDELELRLAAHKIAQIDATLLELTEGVATTTGEAFFLALVQHFTQVFGVSYTYIGLVSGNNHEAIQTIAACAQGQIIDNFRYLLQNTPCEKVIQQRKLCCYPSDLVSLFPKAFPIGPLVNVQSLIAVPFFDSSGEPLGLLCIIDQKPLENVQVIESVLTIFALRIATELERQQTEAARQQAQADLEQIVEQRTAELSKVNELLHLEIRDRQQAETELQKEQEMLQVLLDNVQTGIVSCNAEGIITLFNQASREFHGMSEQPLPPEQWAEYYDLYLPDGKTLMPKEEIPLFRALQGQTVENVEMVIVSKQGRIRTLLANGAEISDAQSNRQGSVVVMHDITERKQAEAERCQLLQEQIREQSARLEAESDQQRSAFLAEISATLSSSLDYEHTLASVADLVVPFLADWCAIDLLQDNNQVIHRVAVAHRNPDKVKLAWELHQQYPPQIDAAEGSPKTLRTGQAEMIAEISDAVLVIGAQDDEHLRILRELNLKSAIVSPLIARGQILGAITLVTAESDRRYSQPDLALAEDVSHRAAIAIDNARLYRDAQQSQQAAERSAEHVTRLQSVTAAFSESITPIQVADVIVNQGITALNASFALLALLNEAGTDLEIIRMVGSGSEQAREDWQTFPLNSSIPLAEAVRTGQPIWAEPSEVRAARYPNLAEEYNKQSNIRAWISIPLIAEGRSIGGISFGFTSLQLLDEEQQAFILSLTQQCAQAIARTHLYEAERIARNEAESANRIKDEFLAVLSHELRSPLNPILGWVHMLRTGMLNPAKTAQALETIERNAKLQTQLIEDLLDISRILQGKLNLNIIPVNLAVIIQSALETVRLAAEAKSIQIQTFLDPTTSQVLGDSVRLQQIVWNLLTNAIKFTPEGGQVQIFLENIGSKVQIQVSDTGKGIAPNFLPHVFERFRQADSTTTRKFGGLGLGLAIVRHLVELHGGTVQADSPAEGQGATFTVSLPMLKLEGQGETNEESNTLLFDSSLPLKGVQVLVVDDDVDTLDLTAFILQEAGASTTVVTSASEALAVFPRIKPDFLVSDIGMPNMNGYSLIQRIRTMPPDQGGQVPAVALTAYAGESNQQQVIAAGFQMHLTKPIVPDALVQAIAKLYKLSFKG